MKRWIIRSFFIGLTLNGCSLNQAPTGESSATTKTSSTQPMPTDGEVRKLLIGVWTWSNGDGWTFSMNFFDQQHYLHAMSNPKFGPHEVTNGGSWLVNDGLLVLDHREFGSRNYRVVQVTATTLVLREESASADQIWHRIDQK